MKKNILIILLNLFLFVSVKAQRSIPDDNLAYPVMIMLSNGSSGTGFYVNAENSTYLVTSKHVLFDNKNNLLANSANIFSPSSDVKEIKQNHFLINLKYMFENKLLEYNRNYDVATLKIGNVVQDSLLQYLEFYDSVKVISQAKGGIVGVNKKNIKKYEDVLIANDVYIFGYPTSLGIPQSPQFDYFKPLLRKGIVAGKYDKLRTIILDCPVYFGNSGGPVLQSTSTGLGYEFSIIGIVAEYIPFAETWFNETQRYSNVNISNSGYSVCVSMDVVLDMLK